MRWLAAVAFCLLGLAARAQWLSQAGVAELGRAGALAALPEGAWAAAANPAGLASVAHAEAGFAAVNHFWLRELTRSSAALALPLHGGQGVGASLSFLGFGEYAEWQAGAAYGSRLWPWLAVGARLGAAGLRLPEFGQATALTADAGFSLRLSEAWEAGFWAQGANRPTLGEGLRRPLPAHWAAAVAWRASAQVRLGLAWAQPLAPATPGGLRLGVDYKPTAVLALRAGAAMAPAAAHAGFSLLRKRLALEAAVVWQPAAGWHAAFGLRARLKRGADF